MKWQWLLVMILPALHTYAQHEEVPSNKVTDTTSFQSAFKRGKVSGHFRNFFMVTNNEGNLPDYHANAIGGGLKYETAPFHGFKLGIGGFYIFNIGSSNLGARDSISGATNRYEIALFDIEDPTNKTDIDRLEELYLAYNHKDLNIVFGKQIINTPFINPQDSRMRPTEVEGLMINGKVRKNLQWDAGWLYNISPRSTVKWYSVAQSIGVYTQGVNKNGDAADYHDNLVSKGIGLLGAHYKIRSGINISLWEQYVQNIFNTAQIQFDFEKETGQLRYFASLQYIRQDPLNNGGNADPHKTYFDKNNRSNILGARAGLAKKNWEGSLNYTRITSDGKFLMPREWGQEPFFTYLSRERNEGLGDVHAIAAKLKYNFLEDRLKLEAGYGQYYSPDVTNYALNKYGLPSYRHIRIMGDYAFKNFLQGFDIALLVTFKDKLGNDPLPPKNIVNKVNVFNGNIIMNYRF
ncbi:outer membrane porin, OprD family [Cnuella takakiae]|uniref:Outer membrane porin, OprD family n=1 Tax=Cnuella takakiae TaxID=1302690 RepID=A0A1M4SG30_9BACT|nr:OprD family outer membrane porin [Cnuella takakiae]OLY94497.1 hypothetical protein BUE76_23450 [Cnuella takakiae]SHE31160.1 outer membrane porin, OprD family [Cnuella takakiae]